MLNKYYWKLPYQFRSTIYRIIRREQFRDLRRLRNLDPETRRAKTLKPMIESQCIFVHIPKCAGISIAYTLFGNLAGGHLSIMDYQRAFTKTEFRNFFKFTIVRNPWDRFVSAYLFLRRGGRNEVDLRWAQENLTPYNDFKGFITGWLNGEKALKSQHFKPQYTYLCLPGSSTPEVDFIGRYEQLDQDFEFVQKRLGQEVKRLPHLNKTEEKRDYRSYYDEYSKSLIAEVYQEDIELFDYDF
jgi:hypothetical protein